MKKMMILAVALLAVACASKNNKVAVAAADPAAVEVATEQVYGLDDLLANAEELTDKTVRMRGTVTHTCKHSGKRCFMVGASQKTSVRVEAKGAIGGFNRELIGSEIVVTGTLRKGVVNPEGGEPCEAEKAGHALYYLDGENYEPVEQ